MGQLVRAQPKGWSLVVVALVLVALLGLPLELARAQDSLEDAADVTAAAREEPRATSGGAVKSIAAEETSAIESDDDSAVDSDVNDQPLPVPASGSDELVTGSATSELGTGEGEREVDGTDADELADVDTDKIQAANGDEAVGSTVGAADGSTGSPPPAPPAPPAPAPTPTPPTPTPPTPSHSDEQLLDRDAAAAKAAVANGMDGGASSAPDLAASAGSDEQRMLMSEIELLRGRLEQLEEREMIYEQIDLLQQRLAALDSGPLGASASQPVLAAAADATGELMASAPEQTADTADQISSSADGGPDDDEEDVWVEGTEAKTQLEELAAQEEEAARKAETVPAVDVGDPVENGHEPDEGNGNQHVATDQATLSPHSSPEADSTAMEPPVVLPVPELGEQSEISSTVQSIASDAEGEDPLSNREQDESDEAIREVIEEREAAAPDNKEMTNEITEPRKFADAAHESGADSTLYTGLCDPPCGKHGSCSGGRCVCTEGFEGLTCDNQQHDLCEVVSCGEHGTCEAGSCVCADGFTGANCEEELASQAVLEHLGLGSKDADKSADNVPESENGEKEAAQAAESTSEAIIGSVAQETTVESAITELDADLADKHAHSEPITDDTESEASAVKSDEQSSSSIPAADAEGTAVASERDALSEQRVVDEGGDSEAAVSADAAPQDEPVEQDAHLHDDDDWIEGTEAKTQLEELAAEEAARAEEEELARKQLELAAENQQASNELQQEEQQAATAVDGLPAEVASVLDMSDVSEQLSVEGDDAEPQASVPKAGTPGAPEHAEDIDAPEPRESQADDTQPGKEHGTSIQNEDFEHNAKSADDVVATPPSDEEAENAVNATDVTGDDLRSQPASELSRPKAEPEIEAHIAQDFAQDALAPSGSMDAGDNSANETEPAPATTVPAPVVDVGAIKQPQLPQMETDVAALSSGTETEAGAETVSSSVADKIKTGTEYGDGAATEGVIETEEQRLERLRAEKKALQDKLGTKKGSKKDAKKPVDATIDVQQTTIKTETGPAADAAPLSVDTLEPRSGVAGKDLNALPTQPQPQPPPPLTPKPAAAAPGDSKLGADTKPSEDEVSDGWDLESTWNAGMTFVDSWSTWWQELFITGPKDEDGSDVKWTTGEDSIVERKELDDRFNYAGFDVGARVLQAHKKTKGARNTLMWDVDQYMSSPCSLKKKWVVLQLSEPLLVEKIMLANFEQYASTFRHFQVLGSATYPVNVPGGPGGWKLLGSFVAKDNNHAQDFMLKTPQWAKYLKVRFLSHYGHEHFCTVSSIKVFGTNMLEDMQRQERLTEQEDQALDEVGAAVTKDAAAKANVLALGSSSGASSAGQVAGAGSASDGSAISKGEGWAGTEPEQQDNVVRYDLNKIQTQSRVDFSRCMEIPWTTDAQQVSLAPDCYHSTGVQMAPAAAGDLADIAAARAVVAGTSAAHAAAQAALAGAQAAAAADENPFRAMTNKIRLLELNHSATVLLVQRLEAENTVVMNELQRTQTARDEAVLAAETLLSEHTAKVQAGHRELRELVQKDAIEIFERVQEAVTAELAQNFSSMLASQDAKHTAQVEEIQQRLEFYAMATVLSLTIAIGQCLCSVIFPVSPRATLQTVTSESPRPLSLQSWSSSEEELTGGVPSTWAQRRRRWRRRRPSDPDRIRTRSSSSADCLEGEGAGGGTLAEGVNLLRASRTDGNIASLS